MVELTQEYEDARFLEFVVKSLVDNPDQVKVDRTVDEMGVLITLDVGREDMGKIIGRSGNTAKSIRTLLRVVGMKNNARVNLKINEPEGGKMDAQGAAAAEYSSLSDQEEFSSPREESEAETVSPEPAADPQNSMDEALEDLRSS